MDIDGIIWMEVLVSVRTLYTNEAVALSAVITSASLPIMFPKGAEDLLDFIERCFEWLHCLRFITIHELEKWRSFLELLKALCSLANETADRQHFTI